MSQLIYVVLFLAAFGGYWWYSQGRKGNRALPDHLGLSPTEQLRSYVTGRHDVQRGAADVGAAMVGMERVGKGVTFALTQEGALVIRTEGGAAQRPVRGSTTVRVLATDTDKLSGTMGQAEPADTVEIASPGIPTMNVVLARSSIQMIEGWNRG